MGKYDDLNSVLLEGRLVKDPELKEFSEQSKVCNFSIANNFSYKMKDGNYKKDASFIDIKVWGNSGKLCNQYLKKGSIIRLRGRITQDRWEDDKGNKKSRLYVTAGHVEFRQTSANSSAEKFKSDIKTQISAKDAIVTKQKAGIKNNDNKVEFTKILSNKEGELPSSLTSEQFKDIPF